ncbi:MAG: hypothetical protein U0935_18635 [Pirellulales bacterium]
MGTWQWLAIYASLPVLMYATNVYFQMNERWLVWTFAAVNLIYTIP